MYSYTSTGTDGNTNDTFSAIANGDLDGNTTVSTFQIDGKIAADVTGAKTVTIAPNLRETLPEE
jgi:hypothetical protein